MRVVRKPKKRIIVAMDEAGRGPLAGPVSVAGMAFCITGPAIFNFSRQMRNPAVAGQFPISKQFLKLKIKYSKILKGIRDSKKLSVKQRNEWFKKLKNEFDYKVAMVGPQIIDRVGISRAVSIAVSRILRRFDFKPDLVILDGALRAPKSYKQMTIIKGDEKIPFISAASIMAKVTRDSKMEKFDNVYPQYIFKQHKGYGTKLHYEMIQAHGISEIHRRSFLKNLSCK